jgi:hypothetical protein
MFGAAVVAETRDGREPDSVEDGWAYTDALGERGRELGAQISALQAELVGVEAEATERLGLPVTQWAAWQLGVTPGEARKLVGLAHKLVGLPKLAAAFGRGELSEGTVTSLVSVATPEDQLLELAEVAMAGQLQTMVKTYARVCAADAAGEVEPDERFSWWWDDAGMLRVSGRLGALAGAELQAALRAAQDNGHVDVDDHRRSEAEQTSVSNPEALLRLAQGYLANRAGPTGVVPERFQTLVHLEVGDDDRLQAWLAGAGPLPQPVLGELLCESWLTTVITQQGTPVTTVRPHRFAQPDQVRALWVRDGRCRFPGCGHTVFLKAHHVRQHQHGGPTRVDNLVLLCQKHHTVIHQPGWTLTYDPDTNTVTVTRPDGRAVAPIPRARPPGDPPPAAGTRRTGVGDKLTTYGKDVILATWLN